MAEKIKEDIEKGGVQLKHVEVQDKSAPQIDPNVHVKKVDREGFLTEVEKGASLKHADTVDKSAPKIEGDVHVKKVDREGFLKEIEKAANSKHTDDK